MQERRYDEKEVAQILSKAAAAQAGSTELVSADGMTLAELQRIAGEVGIDPGNVQNAASELDRQRQDRSGSGSNSVLLEQSVDGEMSEETWERLVTELQSYAGSAGKVETGGQTREWRGGGEVERIMLSATSRNGRTQLKLLVNTSGVAAMYSMLGLVVGFFATIIPFAVSAKHNFPLGAAGTIAMMVVVASAAVLATKGLIYNSRRRMKPRVSDLMDSLVATAEAGVGQRVSAISVDSLASANPAAETATLRETLSS